MAVKKTVKAVEEVKEDISPVCGNCANHNELGFCKLALLAGSPMHVTSHSGNLWTADTFGCNQFEGKE